MGTTTADTAFGATEHWQAMLDRNQEIFSEMAAGSRVAIVPRESSGIQPGKHVAGLMSAGGEGEMLVLGMAHTGRRAAVSRLPGCQRRSAPGRRCGSAGRGARRTRWRCAVAHETPHPPGQHHVLCDAHQVSAAGRRLRGVSRHPGSCLPGSLPMIFHNPAGAPELACDQCGCRWFDRMTNSCYECGAEEIG